MRRAIFRALRRRVSAARKQHSNRRGALFPSVGRSIVTGNRTRSGRLSIGAAAGKITCVPSFLVCIGPHPPGADLLVSDGVRDTADAMRFN